MGKTRKSRNSYDDDWGSENRYDHRRDERRKKQRQRDINLSWNDSNDRKDDNNNGFDR